MTFDDGIRSTATNAAPILADLGIPWTVFIVADWAEGKHELGPELFLDWREIEELAQTGVTIGSHSVTHPDFGRLDARAAASELFESREMIRRRTGIGTEEFAIPFGLAKNWTATAAEAAYEAGYTRVYAQGDELRPPGTEPRTFITKVDSQLIFRAAIDGAFDHWEPWF